MSRRLLPLVIMTAVLAVTALVRTVRMHLAQNQTSTTAQEQSREQTRQQTSVQVVGMPVEMPR